MKNYKSYGFWTALAGAVVMLLNSLGKCFGFTIQEELVTDIIMAIAGLLVVLGVVTMPKKDKNEDVLNENVSEEEETEEVKAEEETEEEDVSDKDEKIEK